MTNWTVNKNIDYLTFENCFSLNKVYINGDKWDKGSIRKFDDNRYFKQYFQLYYENGMPVDGDDFEVVVPYFLDLLPQKFGITKKDVEIIEIKQVNSSNNLGVEIEKGIRMAMDREDGVRITLYISDEIYAIFPNNASKFFYDMPKNCRGRWRVKNDYKRSKDSSFQTPGHGRSMQT